MVFQNEILAGSSGSSASSVYKIDQSIRFNDNDSPKLQRTFGSAGTEETFTFSCWFKRGNIGANLGDYSQGLAIFSGGSSGNNYGEIRIDSSGYGVQDSLHFYNISGGSFNMQLVTSRLFRDPSAWYHIVCVMDTTNAVASERMRIYVNGSRETSFSTETYPSQNTASNYNTASEHGVGVSLGIRSFDGYFAEVQFLDGLAYGPEFFGETNDNGIWIPKEYTGSYGTNGFYIDGRDASDLGDDESGNGNDFASSGLSSDDQVPDSPSNNWCTWNVNDKTPTSVQTISNGNLQVVTSGATSADGISGTQGITSGIWYWESRQQVAQVYNCYIGIKSTEVSNNKLPPTNTPDNNGSAIGYWGVGLYKDGSKVQDVTTSGDGDVVGIVVNLDASPQTVQFYRNGSTSGTAIEISSGFTWLPISSTNSSGYSAGTTSMTNFGQDSTFGGQITASTNSDANGLGNFKYSVPSNALAICTKNLGS